VRRPSTTAGSAGLLLVTCLLLLGSATRATARTWSAPLLIDHNAGAVALGSIACSTPHRCTAVETHGSAEVTFDPDSGKPDLHSIDNGGGGLLGIACPTADQCTAVDQTGREVTFDPASPGTTEPVLVDAGANAIACASSSQCTTVDGAGAAVTFDPRHPRRRRSLTIDAKVAADGVISIACVAATSCTAVDEVGAAFTFDPHGGTVRRQRIERSRSAFVEGIACPLATQCTALETDGSQFGELTFTPGRGRVPIVRNLDRAGGGSLAIACPSDTECVGIDPQGRAVTFVPLSGRRKAIHNGAELSGVTCLDTVHCVAVGADGIETAFRARIRATVRPRVVDRDGRHTLLALACPTADGCVAVDNVGQEVVVDPLTSAHTRPVAIDPHGGGINGIACGSSTACVAVDYNGAVVPFDPTAPGRPYRFAFGDFQQAIACPAATFCTIVDRDGDETSFGAMSAGVVLTRGSVDRHGPVAIACPAPTQCTAVDGSGGESTFDPLAPAFQTSATLEAAPLSGIACPAPTQCTAIDQTGQALTFNPGAPSQLTVTRIDGANALTGIACPVTSSCVAVDGEHHAVEGDPTAAAAWTVTPIVNGAALTAVACVSVDVCVTVGQSGEAFISSASPVTGPAPGGAAAGVSG
jgi:hypothetical protein